MGNVESISAYLSAHKSLATKQHMEQSLSDIFRLMFNLNLAAVEGPSPESEDSIRAYVLLNHERITACVSLRILRTTAMIIAERAGVEVTSSLSAFILQDVACEIVNIIANNLRTFLSENVGIYFNMGEVTVNKAVVDALKPDIVLNLDFQVNPEALVSLGFMCGEDAGTAHENFHV